MAPERIPPQTAPGSAKVAAFGEQLKRAREARGLTLDAVAQATRITRRHLEALERGDLQALPVGPFAKGYIEAYAKSVGIDPGPVLAGYRRREKQQGLDAAERERQMLDQLSHLVEHRVPAKRHGALALRTAAAALAVLGLVALGALGWSLVTGRASRPSTLGPPATRPAVEISPSPSPRDATDVPPPSTTSAPTPARTAVTSTPTTVATVRSTTAPPTAAPLPTTDEPGSTTEAPSPATEQPAAATSEPPTTEAASPTTDAPTDAIEIAEHGVGTDILDRRLVGRSDRFPEGTTVSFWTLVVGAQPGHVVRHVWFQDGRAVMRADLRVGSDYWRTHSRLRLPEGSAGSWAVEARTSDGRLLARDEFLCDTAEP